MSHRSDSAAEKDVTDAPMAVADHNKDIDVSVLSPYESVGNVPKAQRDFHLNPSMGQRCPNLIQIGFVLSSFRIIGVRAEVTPAAPSTT